MYSKVINPEKDGKIAFNNKGSSARLGNYLEKELDLDKTPDGKVFFNSEDSFTKDEMVRSIDTNVKGLTADDDKFYSLVLSPSQAELEHIKNNPDKLREFTVNCMENYAQNFTLKAKDGSLKHLSEKDLVWFANIEYDRTYKGDDSEVKSGKKKQGERKEGLQTHIHITVSARDKSMKITLNPRTKDRMRFSIISWSEKNQQTFDSKFGYDSPKKSFTNQNKEAWNKVMAVERMLTTFEKKYGLSDADSIKIRSLAVAQGYSHDFRKNLKEIGQELKKAGGKNGLNSGQWERLSNAKPDEQRQNMEQDKSSSFDFVGSFKQGFHFFKGAELAESDGKDLQGTFRKAGLHFRKRLQNVQKSTNNDISI
ncbi:DUF5712 family protein [Emticicia oligotrophica]|uniref:DUF5712 family protein n=1 Tax=Emticicia oligotrophica TaxID=312279 RepID=UPI00273C0C70|nr:DUF5712 family protein [Emticicia oligotrophica]